MNNILITGCSKGLGKCLYKKLSSDGDNVIPHTRHYMYDNGVIGDLKYDTTLDGISDAFSKHKINILINNAAIYINKKFDDYSDEDIYNILSTNLLSQIKLIKIATKYLRKNKGLIININSLVCKNIGINESLYAVTKTGISTLSNALQIESQYPKFMDLYIGAMKTRITKNRSNYEELIDPQDVANFVSVIIRNYPTTFVPTEMVFRRV